MGTGNSKQLTEDLTKAQAELKTLKSKAQTLEAQAQTAQAEAAAATQRATAAGQEARSEFEGQLRAKDEELHLAIKQRQLAEELRRSDALLAKRIMCAQLKQAGGGGSGAPLDAGSVVAGGEMAAQLALAAQDEVQLRQALLSVGEQLGQARSRNLQLERKQMSALRSALCDSIWAPGMCDASVALRSAGWMALGGVKLPCASSVGQQDGNGLSPGVAVLRQFGNELAAGGSLLFDTKEQSVSAVRIALSAQPTAAQTVSMAIDEQGLFSGVFKTAVPAAGPLGDGLTMQISAKLDVNQKQRSTFGVHLMYDIE